MGWMYFLNSDDGVAVLSAILPVQDAIIAPVQMGYVPFLDWKQNNGEYGCEKWVCIGIQLQKINQLLKILVKGGKIGYFLWIGGIITEKSINCLKGVKFLG